MTLGQTVFVSGASAGFGRAIAERFLALDGVRVIALARRGERLAQLREQFGDRLHPLLCDIRDRSALTRALTALPPDFANIDVLINNAGLALGLEPAQRASLEDWEQMVDTNIKGLMYLTRALLPGMVERNRGHIVNLGSVAGEFPYPGGNVYGATKAFVHQFSRNLRADLLGTAVRVTVIEPGLAGGTEFSHVRFHGDEAKAQNVYANTQPLLAADIAEAVLWSVQRPPHVNIDVMSILPVCQAFAPLAIARTDAG